MNESLKRYGDYITAGNVATLSVLILLTLNITGFSFQRFRWLSSDEYLQIAAGEIMKTERGTSAYDSAPEILDKNPGRCDATTVNDGVESMIGRLFGWVITRVTVVFRVSSDSEEPYYQEIFFIDRNGEVRQNWGTGSTIPGNYNR